MKSYNWKRFWCHPEGKLQPDENGFLFNPEVDFSQYLQPDVVPFDRIADIPCLILLGEPGIGKTTAMSSEFDSLNAGSQPEGDITDRYDLGSFSSEDRLIKDIFESPEFVDWKQGKHRLHLFLDSLDESRLEIRTIDRILIRELSNAPIDRLTLRIACRTAERPPIVEFDLSELFKPENVAVYELLPLRRIDVEVAARAEKIDAKEFIDFIIRRDIVPLAIKPIILNFLLRVYKRDPKVAISATELYRKGCRLLCEESNERRRAAKHWGKLTADERLALASRIAAVTILCNKFAIFTDIDKGDTPDEDLTIRELCGGKEKMDGQEILVTEDSVREALETGLFTSRGQNRLGWAHQTYAEFLAAIWLNLRGISLPRIKRIMLSSGAGEQKVIPQLHGVAAWLGSMHNGWRKYLIDNQPEILLLGDLSQLNQSDKTELVESLLYQKREVGESLYKDHYSRHFAKLAHHGLAAQLRPYIVDGSNSKVLRVTAMQIAMSCKLVQLGEVIADIAIDDSQEYSFRQWACCAVSKIGDSKSCRKLTPLIRSSEEDDPDDELKGLALSALWPDLISVKVALSTITPLRKDYVIGAYRTFFEKKFQGGLHADQLPDALNWVGKLSIDSRSRDEAIAAVSGSIIEKAIEHIELPEVYQALGKAVLTWRKLRFDGLSNGREKDLRNLLSQNDDRRRLVIEAIVSAIEDPEKEFIHLIDYQLQLIQSKDIPWMIDQYKRTTSDQARKTWAKLVRQVHFWNEPQYFDLILTACFEDQNRILADTFAQEIDPVELGSPAAEKMKIQFEWMMRAKEDKYEPNMLEPLPDQRVLNCLDQFETGDTSAWIQLTREMTLRPDSTHYLNELEPSLVETPGWVEASAAARSRIVKAAEKYAKEGDPETENWFGTDKIHYSALAGYKALLLLKHEAKEIYESLPTEIWEKWAAIILCFIDPDQDLISMAYKQAPSEVIDIVKRIIKEENAKHGSIYIVNRIEHCWDSRMADTLLSAAKDPELKVASLKVMIDQLINHDAGRAFAEDLIVNRGPRKSESRKRAVAGARALLLHAKDTGWSILWPITKENPAFVDKVLLEAIKDSEFIQGNTLFRFNESQLADLYIFIARRCKFGKDLVPNGDYIANSGFRIRNLRDRVLEHLKGRGTAKGVTAIKKIISELPDLQWLNKELSEAEDLKRSSTWEPIPPVELLTLAKESRFLETPTEMVKGHRFHNNGDYWEVRFEGVERTIKDTIGMSYIAYLLQSPNEEIEVTSLYIAVVGQPPTEPRDPHKRMTNEQLEEVGLTGEGLGGMELEVDPQTVHDCKKRIQEVEFQILKAEQSGAAEKEKMLREESAGIRAYLGRTTDNQGRPRRSRNASARMGQSVSRAISRAIKDIGKHHDSLCRHLMNSIHTGQHISYKPDRPISWQL